MTCRNRHTTETWLRCGQGHTYTTNRTSFDYMAFQDTPHAHHEASMKSTVKRSHELEGKQSTILSNIPYEYGAVLGRSISG